MPDERKPFPCNRCGACCRGVNTSPLTAHLAGNDGDCRHLDKSTMLCRIYDKRPDFCRVDRLYEQQFQRAMSWEEFCTISQRACDVVRKHHQDRKKK